MYFTINLDAFIYIVKRQGCLEVIYIERGKLHFVKCSGNLPSMATITSVKRDRIDY